MASRRPKIFNTRNAICAPSLVITNDDMAGIVASPRKAATYKEKRCRHSAKSMPGQHQPRLPHFVHGNELVDHDTLDVGQRQFVMGMAKIYSPRHMKELKQQRYQAILNYEFAKRWITRELKEKQKTQLWKEYERYHSYIEGLSERPIGRFTVFPPHDRYPTTNDSRATLDESNTNDQLGVKSIPLFHDITREINADGSQRVKPHQTEDAIQRPKSCNARFERVRKWVNDVSADESYHNSEMPREPSIATATTTDNAASEQENQI